jgi:hypothetical protein
MNKKSKLKKPPVDVAIINRGPTRADDIIPRPNKLEDSCSLAITSIKDRILR